MSSTASSYRATQQVRTRALVVPREHGAWGILLIPMVTAACVAMRHGHGLTDLALFLTASLALFWLRTPTEVLLGSSVMRVHSAEERRYVWKVTAVLSVAAAAPLYLLLRQGRNQGLLVLGAMIGCVFALQAGMKLFGRRWRMLAQMVGAIGLTATAPGAYYVVTGKLDTNALALWFVNWLFAGDQIHYVQLRLHTSKLNCTKSRFQRGWVFLTGQIVMLSAVAAAVAFGMLPSLVLIAFVPVVLRGMVWLFQSTQTLDLQWLGITELLHAITFGVLVIMSYYVRV